MKTILEFKNVKLTYQTKQGETLAVKDVSFKVKEGEFIAIVGPSGCGKSTLLSLSSGILKPTEGEVFVDNQPANEKSGITGYMFQHDHLFGWRKVYKNVVIGLELQKIKEKEPYDYAKNLLIKYGLGDFLNSYPSELSGGMRQRAALIRTLALNPKVLLLDEAFSALDFQTRLNVCDDVSNIICQEGKTAILVTHDLSEAISMADRIIVLSQRPCVVKKIFDINLKSAGSPLKRREHPDFAKLFDKIWKELQISEEK